LRTSLIAKIIKILWGTFLFSFPFSLRSIIYETASYRFGNFNPFVSGFIYLPEILLGLIFILWAYDKLKVKNLKLKVQWNSLNILLLLFVVNAVIVSLLNGNAVLLSFFLLRIVEAGFVYILITEKLLPLESVVIYLLCGAGFQILLGYLQWRMNHSIGLSLLGEQMVGPDIFGVAKTDVAEGIKQIRPYGTFLHPNIFAAYLMSILFISLRHVNRRYILFWIILLTTGIFFTSSLAAEAVTTVGFALVVIFSVLKNVNQKKSLVLGLLIILLAGNLWIFQKSDIIHTEDTSWQERLDQNVLSRQMFLKYPLGVGVNGYTLKLEEVAEIELLPWEFQPVHNGYFLILNEVGIQGLLLLLAAISLLIKRYWDKASIMGLIALILIAPLDHFLWDAWISFILIAMVVGFFKLENSLGFNYKIEN